MAFEEFNRPGFTLSNPGLGNPWANPAKPGLGNPWSNPNALTLDKLAPVASFKKDPKKPTEEKSEVSGFFENAPSLLYQEYLDYQKQVAEEENRAFTRKVILIVFVAVGIIVVAAIMYKKK